MGQGIFARAAALLNGSPAGRGNVPQALPDQKRLAVKLTKIAEDSVSYKGGGEKLTKEALHKVINTVTQQMKAAAKG